ncbi:DoxX family protein [Photobacterium lipolyticum]|uniref:DoxD-like family protein n=1 Tax=Photobacterium lipolyticum TaxID=266810 RepID=A0A2T3N312_9GAMM|nr:DoxX family protein [Photobacterium lipolyticum]PSW06762.1 DoxD-like family protein [Photobacterium lipolyticum]
MNSKIIKSVLNTTTSIAPLTIRIPLGIVLAAHGAQKLFGWFGGYGLEGTGQWMASIGFEPGMLMAFLAGSGEFFGGIALMFGLLTRPAAIVTGFTMLIAMTVHWGNGLFLANNGYEFALILLFASVSLAIQGGGRYSLDNLVNSWLQSRSYNGTDTAA